MPLAFDFATALAKILEDVRCGAVTASPGQAEVFQRGAVRLHTEFLRQRESQLLLLLDERLDLRRQIPQSFGCGSRSEEIGRRRFVPGASAEGQGQTDNNPVLDGDSHSKQ